MVIMVRVDDRLLHGQIICAWVPDIKAESLVVVSDEAAGDELAREIICSCAHKGLGVEVMGVAEAVREGADGAFDDLRAIVIVGGLTDAMRLYREGMRFTSLNIGNIHHVQGGRMLTPSVIVDPDDEAVIAEFQSLGVEIDIRAVPASQPGSFAAKNGQQP